MCQPDNRGCMLCFFQYCEKGFARGYAKPVDVSCCVMLAKDWYYMLPLTDEYSQVLCLEK